ncbi:SRPBCC family protein [Corallococcus terminator]|uniref:SRPBCC family protein n=1 Tax=Corallococcus terminator TaxID=2316733 RepID=UPI0013156CF3|nr:SRPBCC family protein [Corallococcus terminator]
MVAGTLVSLGLRRRSFGGTVVALASGALLYQGLHSRRRSPAAGDRLIRHASPSEDAPAARAIQVERTLTVGQPAELLYRLWRMPETLGRIMGHFAEVTRTGEDSLHWKLHGPLGRTLEWDSRIVEDRPPEFIRWESTHGNALATQGWVRFRPAPTDGGTEVTLHLELLPPGGVLAEALAKRLSGIPALQSLKALRRFKSLAETGEIPSREHEAS